MTLENTPNLNRLIARIKKLTKPRGKKAELARFLNVPMPRVSEWMNAGFRPGGEITLLMLEWVQAEEDKQQKSPDRASTQPGRKTRLGKSCHEKPKSGPP